MSAGETPRATLALGPPPQERAGTVDWALGHLDVLAAIAGLSFLVARFVPIIGIFPPCPFRALLGVPCATCGMTHAFVALAHGDVAAAAAASPLGAAMAAGAWAFALAAVLRPFARFRWPALAPAAARAAALVAVVALVVNWAWLVTAGSAHP